MINGGVSHYQHLKKSYCLVCDAEMRTAKGKRKYCAPCVAQRRTPKKMEVEQQTLMTSGSPYAPYKPDAALVWPMLNDLATRDPEAMDYIKNIMGTAPDNPRRIAGPILERLASALNSIIQNPEMGRDIAISALYAGQMYNVKGDQTHGTTSNESVKTG